MQIVYLEDITESWKAETLENIKEVQSQDTLKRVWYTHGTKGVSALWEC